jgi:hypothetical protein
MEERMLERLTFEEMKALEGTRFWLYPEPDHRVELRVLEVTKVMENKAARLTRIPFSILFLGPASYPVKQGTFTVSHDGLPEPFPLFVVPLKQVPEGFVYEAVFS